MTIGASIKVFIAVIVGIRKSTTVHIPRRASIIKVEHVDFPSHHRLVTWERGGGLALV